MSTKRIEAVALAIGYLNDFQNPDSVAHQTKNPTLSRAYSFKHLDSTNADGIRIFSSVIGGLRFACEDIRIKCEGSSRAKGFDGRLKPESALKDLLLSYKQGREERLFEAVDYIQRSLGDATITLDTQLSYFLEEA